MKIPLCLTASTAFVPKPKASWGFWTQALLNLLPALFALPALDAVGRAASNEAAPNGPQFIAITSFQGFTRTTNGFTVEILSSNLHSAAPWNELVLSWQATTPGESFLEFRVKPVIDEASDRFYSLGVWSTAGKVRHSVTGQKDGNAEVQTDVLVLQKPATDFQVRIRLEPEADSLAFPELRFLGISLVNTATNITARSPQRGVWGKTLDVPERSQLDYPGGRGWCSPTSVSMVLSWWAAKSNQPRWDKDVPEVAAAVHDPQWPGTGNWSFNAAYAATLGLRAIVVRLHDLTAVEEWIQADVPVICSVAYPLLQGKSDPGDSGHLVVCIGFTPEGDVVTNDPWAPKDDDEGVRKVFARRSFSKAWEHSHQTAYLIFPEAWPHPELLGLNHGASQRHNRRTE